MAGKRKQQAVAYEPRRLDEEQQLQQALEADLARFGWLAFHDRDSRKNNSGLTDIVAVHPVTGTLLLWELKAAHGRLSVDMLVTTRFDPRLGRRVNLSRPHLRRGQTTWRAALIKTMRRAPGVMDYRVVRPQTYQLAIQFLVDEHIRAGEPEIDTPGRLL